MITWWVALTFPLIGLVGLCVLLRPAARTGKLAGAVAAERTGRLSTPTLPAGSRADPPAM